MDVSENSGTPKSSILIGFSTINHPFWGTPIFGNTHIPSVPSFGKKKRPHRSKDLLSTLPEGPEKWSYFFQ